MRLLVLMICRGERALSWAFCYVIVDASNDARLPSVSFFRTTNDQLLLPLQVAKYIDTRKSMRVVFIAALRGATVNKGSR